MKLTIKGKTLSFSNTISLQLLELIIFFLLILSYVIVVSTDYGYMGFENDFSFSRILISLTVVLFFIQMGKWLDAGLLHAIWHMVLIICLLPHLVFYAFSSGNLSASLGYMIFLLVLFFFSKLKLHNINSKVINIQQGSNLIIVLGITLILFLPFLYYLPYVNIRNLWFKDIYETRIIFRNINSLEGLSYLLSPLSRVLLPALIIVGLKRKKGLLVLLIISLTAYLYLASGAVKSVYFGIFMAIFFYFGQTYKIKLQTFIYLLIFLNIFGVLEYLLTNHSIIQDYTIRRVFFIPPLMEDVYYSFFSTNEKTFYTHSILSFIGESNYDLPLSRFIGEDIIGREGLNANVGVIPDGYLSLGWTGVLINSSIISYTFLLLDRMKIDIIFFGVIFTYIYYFNTAFLGTLLLTHGFLFLILFAFFCLKNYENN